MIPLLSISLISSLTPGCIALIDSTSKKMKVISGSSIAKITASIMNDLRSGCYRYRTLQKAYNQGTLELELLEKLDDIPSNIEALMVRWLQTKWTKELEKDGYVSVSSYNALQLTIDTTLLRGHSPQVTLRTGRYRTLYVQRPFNSIKEADQYINNTTVDQMIVDTGGIEKPFLYKVLRREAKKWEEKGKAGRPKGSPNRYKKPKFIHPLIKKYYPEEVK